MRGVYIGTYDKWPHPLSRYSSAKARGSRGGKPHPHAYYILDNGGVRVEKVKGLARILPKGPVYKRKKFVCLTCRRSSIQLIPKGSKDNLINCPYCNQE